MNFTILNSKKGNKTNDNFKYESINLDNILKKDNKNYVDDLLDKAYKTFLPWMSRKTEDNKKIIYLDTSKYDYKPDYTILDVTPYALNLEWNKAASRLLDIAYYMDHPTYDFMIDDIAIKIHGNYIQIGSEIIPTFTKAKDFKKFDKDTQINLYYIAVIINNIAA